MDGAAEHFCPGIAVPVLECCVYIQEPPFRQRCDGERNWARTKDLLELLLRDSAPFLRLQQRGLGLAKILYASFQFLAINLCAFVKTGVLDCRRRGNCQQFCPPDMVLSEAVGLRVADGKKSQVPPGRDQRNAQPGAQMCMSLERLPRFL